MVVRFKSALVVFIIGPLLASEDSKQEENIRAAEGMAKVLWGCGFSPVCMHAQYRFMQGVITDGEFFNGYVEQMLRCDCVIALDGWENSVWAKSLLHDACEGMIPKFFSLENLLAWYGGFDGIG